MESPQRNEDIKESSRSDISALTDMKVFQGYLGNNDLFKRLNEDQNTSKGNINDNQQDNKSKQNNLQSPNTTAAYLSKLNDYKDENIKCNNDQPPQLFLLKTLPLESSLNKVNLDLISFGNGTEFTNKPSSPIANSNDEDDKSNTSKQSRKSKKSNMSLNDPQNEESNNNSGNNQMKAFITTLNDEEDTRTNLEDKDNSKQNFFWKLRHQDDELSDNNDLNRNKEDFQQLPLKTLHKVLNSFTISKIEKGIALLVSCDDGIFTLPTFLLPHGAKIENTYKLSIEENCSLFESQINLQSMQKRLLNKQNANQQ